ncbi:MAG: regulatory signaling modulator protein AmpE [Woeseiaceae bacterium]|nr:regulatory signaling modulator protein AmpE [Woeseiaceae bacterium]
MNLIALLIGLAIERLGTRIFHWRRMRWMERIIDAGFRRAGQFDGWPALIPVLVLAALLSLPVAVVILLLGDAFLGFPYLVLAIIVLFFSLGPQDIGEDVDEYCEALREEDETRIRQTAKSLVEGDVHEEAEARLHQVESAVFVQANNRLFAIIFWFVALGPLGPLGAWAYRVTDLMRRRAVFNAAREAEAGTADAADEADTADAEDSDDEAGADAGTADAVAAAEMRLRLRNAAVSLHGWLAWIPARLTAVGYAVAGHFDGALGAWRAPAEHDKVTVSEGSELLLARVGNGALALHDSSDESLNERAIRGAIAANRLVFRLLLIWAVIIAALTLYGWSL